MLRLRTLGTLAIESDRGLLTGAAAQPKRLKLLALLDRAGERGMNREQLADHLWSDSDEEHARRSLHTAVNAIRQHLGADVIVAAGEQLQLDRELVASDARDFEAAIRDGRLEDAVALYGGPFLDGNDRRESARFEEWVSIERERLESRWRKGLETLAVDAGRHGDWPAAIGWWDRLVAADPLDSRVAAAFVRALVDAGDPARALRVAGIHEALLRQNEFESTPEWTDTVTRLRDGRLAPPPAPRSEPPPPASPAPPVERVAEPLTADGAPTSASPPSVPEQRAPTLAAARRSSAPTAALAAAAALALAAGAWYAWPRSGGDGTGGAEVVDPAAELPRVAVLYFADRSAGAALGHVADGLTESLIDDLQQVATLRVIAPDGVRQYRDGAAPLDSVARRLRVGTIVSGAVDSVADSLRVTIRLVDATTAELLASETVSRPLREAPSLERLVALDVADALRRRLGEEIRLREQRGGTSSAEAWELVQRARRTEAEELSPDVHADPADLAATYERVDSLLARAERLDPTWPVPAVRRAGLAEERAIRATQEGGTWPPSSVELRSSLGVHRTAEQWRREGLAHAERALRLGPGEPEALHARGELRFGLWRWSDRPAADSLLDAAIADLQAAVDAKPYLASAASALSFAHRKAGNPTAARRAAERALDSYLGPDAPSLVVDLLFIALHDGRWADARRLCERGQTRFPDSPQLRGCELTLLGWSAARPADAARARRIIDSVETVEPAPITTLAAPQRRMFLAAVFARAGMADSAEAMIREARSRDPVPGLDDDEAWVRLLLGQRARALTLLRRYLDEFPADRRVVATTPWFAPLRTDPEFGRLTSPRG